ncbi:hypothetical protein GGF32_005823 [Allomyces javanicus]|nr:hypothetical protein GGF32_005823 [Allomyces javanicus]
MSDNPGVIWVYLESGIAVVPSKMFRDGIDLASTVGNTNVLEYCKRQRHVLVPLMHFATVAHLDGPACLKVLEWWGKSGYGVTYAVSAVALATEHGRLDVLEWWSQHEEDNLNERFARSSNPDVIAWWLQRSFTAQGPSALLPNEFE